MSNLNGDQFPLKTAFGNYMHRWYGSLYGDTKGVLEFTQRGFPHCCQWTAGRLVDDAEAMLESYRKNDNAPQGRNTLLPVVLVGMAKDYATMGADWGGRQMPRQVVAIEPGGSAYGLRIAMHEVRTQVVIIAADVDSAKSLAAQFGLFIGNAENRRFEAVHQFGQYKTPMPVVIETPDIVFMNVATGQKNITMLAADITLKASIPYWDAPKAGEENDGTTNNPPGYRLVSSVSVFDEVSRAGAEVNSDGTTWQ